MPNETEVKKTRKPKEERSDLEQEFMDAVHFWRKHPFREAFTDLQKKALAFKREKTGDEAAEL